MKIITRPVLCTCGFFFVFLGTLGAFLPVLPTVPFMILALWCFARSSKRFHDWLYNHKIFGPQLQMWDKHRVIPVIAKVASVSSMTLSFLYLLFFKSLSVWLLAIIFLVMAYAAYYILSKPSKISVKQG